MATVAVFLRGFPRLSIRLYEMVEDVQNTGIMVARKRGDAVVLSEGRNDIDAEFWHRWREQNKASDLVMRSIITDDETTESKS